jgi:phospholipase C
MHRRSRADEVRGRAPGTDDVRDVGSTRTTTPIERLVVIYDENVSFDHYFGT